MVAESSGWLTATATLIAAAKFWMIELPTLNISSS
jgi:hypothetical protein